ncbi:hypothetical protein PFICI_06839 [Pestalotiopsis fici W106-1]|uniref:DUF3835 domain-containing protein n=1 Tax=Pestalotiopsis fici (strain W106-1 / CGMCC3.15140) TaxID=1229662 RepID=W3X8X0_PESFW|nr:uncharacterized protein PFICI_06839 [Pestalotiopsis fici W106-1]ETS81837.1 hypothetical protein PFICI_06839 [Pestalotiopsis fici W106-1]
MSADGSIEQLEQQRQKLEETAQRTRALLDEWRQWKQDYEGLKRELDSVPSDAPPSEIQKVRAAYKGRLVKEQELANIFGEKNTQRRDQITSTLVNRADYVGRNISTLEKQLIAIETELSLTVEHDNDSSTSEDEYIPDDEYPEDDSGLPVTEILEELDEDDNVISYSLRTPGNNQPQLMEALEKAGLKEIPSAPATVSKKGKEVERPAEKAQAPVRLPSSKPSSASVPPKEKMTAVNEEPAKPQTEKKSVRFTEETKAAEVLADTQPEYMTLTAASIDELMREANKQEAMISDPRIPNDEDEDDAQLRRDMLQYNLSELNPVIAELTLEDGAVTDDDEDGWDLDEDEDYDTEDEDQWGRSKASYINDEYRQKMLEIEQRLRNHTFESSTKDDASNSNDTDNMMEGIAKIRVKNEDAVPGSVPNSSASSLKPEVASDAKKNVRFASTLDVAEESAPAPAVKPAAVPPVKPQTPEVDPLSDIVERKSPAALPASAPAPVAKKASRFKMARGDGAANGGPTFKAPVASDGSVISPEVPVSEQQFAPSGPEGQTMATAVLERAPTDTAREPDEFDADMLKQQAAVEYHKVRNRMIQKQGGFMKEDESPIQPLDEEEGGPKRMSRFKAARLAKS